jgi:hypothetical protein
MARERNPVLKGLLRIRRYNQQETPYALQEVELLSWLQFGEAYSALRGWRPIPAALLSHSVLLCSGTEDNSLPTQRLRTSRSRPTQGKSIPDKHRSIGKKTRPVKSFARPAGEFYAFWEFWPRHAKLPGCTGLSYLKAVYHSHSSKSGPGNPPVLSRKVNKSFRMNCFRDDCKHPTLWLLDQQLTHGEGQRAGQRKWLGGPGYSRPTGPQP